MNTIWKINGQYTVVGISSMLAMTNKMEIKVRDIDADGNVVFVFKGKRKLKTFMDDTRTKMIVFPGWEIPLKIDSDQETPKGEYMGGYMTCGNACYNFMGTPDEVRHYIDKNNLNEYFNRHDAVLAHGKKVISGSGVPVYPEVPTTHAVVLKIREKLKIADKAPPVIYSYDRKQAVEDGVLMKNPRRDIFQECDIITTNLMEHATNKVLAGNFVMTEAEDLIGGLMKMAKEKYAHEQWISDEDKDFFKIKGDNEKVPDVWFVRNENAHLTAMLPEDY